MRNLFRITKSNSSFFYLLASLLFSLSFTSCTSVPYTNRSQLMLSSESSEISDGKEVFNQIKNKANISNDEKETNQLNRVGTKIAKAADKPNYYWQFLLVENSEANAFCLPGGGIVVFTGMYKYISSDGDMATILGHEVGHAIARHYGEQVSRGYITTAGGIGTSVVSATLGIPGIDTAYGVATGLGIDLPYSRAQEYEADYIGLMLMAKAGYDPKDAISFWNRFSAESQYGDVAEFFATHPNGENRIKELEKALPDAEQVYLKNKR